MDPPGAARVVGQACNANPLALIVPCHRGGRDFRTGRVCRRGNHKEEGAPPGAEDHTANIKGGSRPSFSHTSPTASS
ncbi:MGMT family protein [Thiovibrio frasassiensis]|uniref:MGMT family protein n=1 Tax=Thiovibrio frasassiensis TaxID=2984131 RepID=UPI0035316BBB